MVSIEKTGDFLGAAVGEGHGSPVGSLVTVVSNSHCGLLPPAARPRKGLRRLRGGPAPCPPAGLAGDLQAPGSPIGHLETGPDRFSPTVPRLGLCLPLESCGYRAS